MNHTRIHPFAAWSFNRGVKINLNVTAVRVRCKWVNHIEVY